jgi:hypothetical protein
MNFQINRLLKFKIQFKIKFENISISVSFSRHEKQLEWNKQHIITFFGRWSLQAKLDVYQVIFLVDSTNGKFSMLGRILSNLLLGRLFILFFIIFNHISNKYLIWCKISFFHYKNFPSKRNLFELRNANEGCMGQQYFSRLEPNVMNFNFFQFHLGLTASYSLLSAQFTV